MRKLILVISTLLITLSSLAYGLSIQSLNKLQVINTLQNKTIVTIPLITLNNELINNTFTGYFDKNNQLQGRFSAKPDNDPQSDQGKWLVEADGTLCATWQHWHQGKPVCVTVYKLENGLLFVNKKSKKIETVVLDANIKSGNQLS